MISDQNLWQRIRDHDLDAGAARGYFATKLAHDNGWRHAYAVRVVAEYRRYVYIACVSDHMVVPSEQVDMAWHQHLLDTRPYWDVFCTSVLQRPLHHLPSKGGAGARAEHLRRYQQTLHSYIETFGSPPPEDIWPPAAQRFRSGRRSSVANESWVVPKRRVRLLALACMVAVACGATVAAAPSAVRTDAASLDLPAMGWGIFFAILAALFVIALVLSIALRRRLLGGVAGELVRGAAVPIDPYEAAVLGTNSHLAVNVAVAALVRDDAVAFDRAALSSRKHKYRLVPVGPLPADAHPLERTVYTAVSRPDTGISLSDIHSQAREATRGMLSSLRERGLLIPHHYIPQRIVVASPLIAVAAVGATRFAATQTWVLLVLLVVGLSGVIAIVARAPDQLTVKGAQALDVVRARHLPVVRIERDDVPNGRELSWVVALFGAHVLAGGSFHLLRDAIIAPASQGGGGAGIAGAGCGGGTGGDGDGGCGGDGGGCGGD